MYLVDVQGTLIDDEKRLPIDGAIEFIQKLHDEKIPFILITNNTKYSSEDFKTYLRSLGFVFDDNQYLDPFMALDGLMHDHSIWAIGNDGFVNALKGLGFRFDEQNPEALILSLKENLSYEDLATAVEMVLGGAKLIGMHETAIYAKNKRKYPGLGALLRAIEYATHTKALIVGKPSDDFYDMARQKLGANSFGELTIISDDAIGDLVGAKELGMRTILVLSGKYRDENEIVPFLTKEKLPDKIVKSIAHINIKASLCN